MARRKAKERHWRNDGSWVKLVKKAWQPVVVKLSERLASNGCGNGVGRAGETGMGGREDTEVGTSDCEGRDDEDRTAEEERVGSERSCGSRLEKETGMVSSRTTGPGMRM